MSDHLQAIEHQRGKWIAAVNARDVGQYLEILSEDIVWIPPGQAAISGRTAFESWVRPFFAGFTYEFAIHEPRVQLAGDWAVETGAFETKMTSLENQETGHHTGKYLVLWRKDGGDPWKIERYVDQSD